jgi:hypothetical protein
MKTSIIVGVVCLGIALGSRAQPAPPVQQSASPPANTVFSPINRGANSCVWQWQTYQQNPDGSMVTNVHQFTELATGLNYLVNGE